MASDLVKVQLETDATRWTYSCLPIYLPAYLSICLSVSSLWPFQLMDAASVCIARLLSWSLTYAERCGCERRCVCELKRVRAYWNPRVQAGTYRTDESSPGFDGLGLLLEKLVPSPHSYVHNWSKCQGHWRRVLGDSRTFSDSLLPALRRWPGKQAPQAAATSLPRPSKMSLCPLQLKLFQKKSSEKQLSPVSWQITELLLDGNDSILFCFT